MRMSAATVAALTLLAATSACQKAPAPAANAPAPISEAEAAKLADATVAAWGSMDAAKIKALYAPAVNGFDYAVRGLSPDRATWDKRQDAFAAAKIDTLEQKERAIQILDADTFVVSGIWLGTSSASPQSNGEFRCTDVYQKDAAGAWPIITEHCSMVPKPA